jgi:glutathione S-transferase
MLMLPINTIIVETVILPPERSNEANVKRARKLLGQMLLTIETHMEGREFLAGNFSGADIMLGHDISGIARFGDYLNNLPHLRDYAKRLNARPALQKARML